MSDDKELMSQLRNKYPDAYGKTDPGDPITLSQIIIQSYRIAHEKGWHSPSKTFVESVMLIVTELSEAVEEYRAGRDERELYYGEDGKPEGIPAELADAVIRIADLVGALDIDLEQAIVEKMAYNQTRPFRHGGKRA
jgi:NTP pyrophosphatase (non-canonical NTP hydrolase)